MQSKIISFFGVLLLIVGCRDTTQKKEDEILIGKFPKEALLSATEIEIPPIILKPSNMCIVDTFLVVSQSRQDTIFSIFKIPNCDYLLSFGNQGKGPTEFFNMNEYTTLGSVYKKNNSFAVANLMTRIQYYNVIDIINHNFVPYKTVRLPPKLSRFRSIAYVGDSLVFGAPYGGKMHLFKFYSLTKVLESFKNYPQNYPLMNSNNIRDLYGCSIAVKPDNSKLVVSYSLMGKIEIYDLNINKQITLSYKGFPSFKKNLGIDKTSKYWEIRPEMLMFCEKIVCTNKYIYARIDNNRYSKIYDKYGWDKKFIPEIYVFDWFGNPITKYKLNKFYNYFIIDNNDKYLYAINDTIEDKFFRYDLSI